MRELILRVITSWQVIVVTVVFVFYCFLVNAAARLSYKSRVKRPIIPKKDTRVLPPPAPPEGDNDAMGDDLGLEE
ncbi:MAG: hypothetical protein LBL19_00605 [Spirochaetaceae bacterium]|jgi:hypothetical protein|nr:hypothetical protein [Spirochaetaceae bacterium]